MPDIDETSLVDDGALPPDDFHESIERIREVAEHELNVPADLQARIAQATEDLLVSEDTLKAAAIALQAGHVVLYGPPGTGKSSIARALCKAFHVEPLPVTAHEDWSVYEVIGRLELYLSADGKEALRPVNGFFTEAVVRCAGNIVRNFDDPNEPQAEWLLIDELNRAHLDRAFGELFTVIGTHELIATTLPHQPVGNRDLVVPKRFRIVATLNSFDRQFVHNLSQAIRRRFAFIECDIPPKRSQDEQFEYANAPQSLANREVSVVIRRAAERVALRAQEADVDELLGKLSGEYWPQVKALFEMIEKVRYAKADSGKPHLPIGTAQIIDTVELFLLRALYGQGDRNGEPPQQCLDWATSVKLAPLFDADQVSPDLLRDFANGLSQAFQPETKRALLRIVAAGIEYVE